MARNKFDVDEVLISPFNFKQFRRSFVYVKRYGKLMIIALVLNLFSSFFSLCSPMLIREAMNKAIPNRDVRYLMVLTGILVATIVVSIILAVIRSRIMNYVGQSIIHDVRLDLYTHLQKLPFSYYDNRPHGKILVRVINYVNAVQDMLSNGMINFVLELFNIILIIVFMMIISPMMALVVVSGIPVFLLVLYLIKPRQRKYRQIMSNKSSNLNAYLHESLNGMKITQAFTREETNRNIMLRLSDEFRYFWMKGVKVSNLTWFTSENLAYIIFSALYIIGIFVMVPTIPFGTIYAMGDYTFRFWQPINNLANIYNNFMISIAYLERILETIDEKVDVDDIPGAVEMPKIQGEVDFDHVVFQYEKGTTVLKDLSFHVNSGESIALVGHTGCGKTTIINTLSRFYDLTDGKILIDGVDIKSVTLQSLRRQMGIMLQDSVVFSGTVAENIRYGRLDATAEEIIHAAKVVRADEFISQMPDGYETEIKERGGGLSQGQKQLISFARTLLADPKILILDEATSSIDTKTERLLQQGIAALLKGRTSFIIAHRLSTIRSCDRIMYIEAGEIMESGTHDELMAKKGYYYELYNSQLS